MARSHDCQTSVPEASSEMWFSSWLVGALVLQICKRLKVNGVVEGAHVMSMRMEMPCLRTNLVTSCRMGRAKVTRSTCAALS